MGDAWDVLCPSGRVGFSPNPRVSQQETPRLLITEPPADLLSAQTQTTATRKQVCTVHTQHRDLNCKGARQDPFTSPSHSTNIFPGMCQYWEEFWYPMETYSEQHRHRRTYGPDQEQIMEKHINTLMERAWRLVFVRQCRKHTYHTHARKRPSKYTHT